MKTKRIVVGKSFADGSLLVMEKEVDQEGNVVNLFLRIDGMEVAKRVRPVGQGQGRWEPLYEGWIIGEAPNGDIECWRPGERLPLN